MIWENIEIRSQCWNWSFLQERFLARYQRKIRVLGLRIVSLDNPPFICLSKAWAMGLMQFYLLSVCIKKTMSWLYIIFIILAQKVCRGQKPNGANWDNSRQHLWFNSKYILRATHAMNISKAVHFTHSLILYHFLSIFFCSWVSF